MKKFLLALSFITVALFAQAQKNLVLTDTLNFPGQSLAGCWHYTDSTNHTYAVIGVKNALVIADIQNQNNISVT